MKKFIFYQDQSPKAEWRWKLLDGNNKTVADSGEGYSTKSECEKKANLFTVLGPPAPVRFVDEFGKAEAEWVYFEDKAGEWRWRFTVPNNADKILADSSEGYETKAGVLRAIENVKQLLKDIAEAEKVKGYQSPVVGGTTGSSRFA